MFERAKKELGDTGVIDLVGIIGYYSLVSVTLNAFEMPLPEGEKVPFAISLPIPSPACGRGWRTSKA